jgi:AcrR family transcriptional regulator
MAEVLGTASESDERRILEAARVCFAESGYVHTSVLEVAARADVAPDVPYRRFRSKRALFLSVFDEVERFVYGSLRSVARTQLTFVTGVEASLNEVCRLSQVAPSEVRFIGTVGAELAHVADLRAARSDYWPARSAFVSELIEVGERTGELACADRLVVADTITAMLDGLWQINVLLPNAQSGAVEGFIQLLSGALLRSASPSE